MKFAAAPRTSVLTAVDAEIISALWSRGALADHALELMKAARRDGPLVICSPVYAELMANSGGTPEFVNGFLDRAYARRRRKSRAEAPRRIVADFLIGMHATVCAQRLLTFDADGFKQDFPELLTGPGRSN
jgi:hypothetical protein